MTSCVKLRSVSLLLAVGLMALPPSRVHADPLPGSASNGCAGETYRVAISRNVFIARPEGSPGNYKPGGFLRITSENLSVHGTYVRELRDGKLRWVSRSIDWSGQFLDSVPQCNSISCDAGGHLELGFSDGNATGMSADQENEIKYNCQPVHRTGNCFGYSVGAPTIPIPVLRGARDILRSGCCYSRVDPDGTRYSETVEQRGNLQVSIAAEPDKVSPNQSVDGDEATSQLTVKVTCDGMPLKDEDMGVRIDVKPRSGEHNHVALPTNPRPRGSLIVKAPSNCGYDTGEPIGNDDSACTTVTTDANGEAKLKFKVPLDGRVNSKNGKYYGGLAGTYKITAKSMRITEARASTQVIAAVDGLTPLAPVAGVLEMSGGSDSHPDNSWATPGVVNAFTGLANDFHKYQDLHNKALVACGKKKWKPEFEPLSYNDIALPEGGLFDCKTSPPHSAWAPPHQTHPKGEGGDINRFGASQGINFNNTGTECDGSTAVLQLWYMQVLLELGKKYGRWDCFDLGASKGLISPAACAAQDFPDLGFAPLPPGMYGPPTFYFPPNLHLHVYSYLGGDG